MFTLSGYTLGERVYEGNKNVIYRGIRKSDNLPVLFKYPKSDYPHPLEIERLKYEYEINQKISSAGIIKIYSLEKYQNNPILVLEDIGGESLKSWMNRRGPLELKEFLKIAIKLVDTLGFIHHQHIIHMDLNPNNIIVNNTALDVRITDFGSCILLPRENVREIENLKLEGTLAYISPEQTGRMNHRLDYRTDFYSLGVTFYEILSGVLPFDPKDNLELIHCHLARKPVPLYRLRPEIPRVISDIIAKLMEKEPEQRYQSAPGLKSDLIYCLEQLEGGGPVDSSPFEIGKYDVSDRLEIPPKLYGREREIGILLDTYHRVKQGSCELVLLNGPAGIGKSSLVKVVRKLVVADGGWFISGKFDPYQRSTPYSALISAFNGLIRQILAESEETIAVERKKLLDTLDDNGQIIINLIPELELVIGAQPAVPELPPLEAQNRFHRVFQNFVRVLGATEHPLVISLDDLQWADLSGLKLLEIMLTNLDGSSLLVVGTYRDDEVNETHPLMETVHEIEKIFTRVITRMELRPLKVEEVNRLLSETLRSKPENSEPLASICLQKTGGNPFFLHQFLHTIHNEQFLKYVPETRDWQWDISGIETVGLTDNIIDLMVGMIEKLSPNSRELLLLGACIGNPFDLKTLSMISNKIPDQVADDLWEPMERGLIYSIDNRYPSSNGSAEEGFSFQFIHDRIQQAAYTLIPEPVKKQIHSQIGWWIYNNAPAHEAEDKIFEIVNHLNFSAELMNSKEIDQLILLNLNAGERAKSSNAYEAAYKYFSTGIRWLSADSWQERYDLTLKLYTGGIETAYFCLEFETMNGLIERLLNRAHTVMDMVKAYEIKIQACLARNNLQQAIETARAILNRLHVTLPQEADYIPVGWEFLKTWLLLLGKKVDRLINLPPMSDPEKLAAFRIISRMFSALFISNQNLTLIFALKQINMSILRGNAPASAYSYAIYGSCLAGILKNINKGYQFGELALRLAQKPNMLEYKAKILYMVAYQNKVWKEPLHQLLPLLMEGYQCGLENGDFEFAAHCATDYGSFLFFLGEGLNIIEQELAYSSNVIRRLQQKTCLYYHEMLRQFILNFSMNTENVIILKGQGYNEEESLPVHLRENDEMALALLYRNKGILCYFFEEYAQGLEYWEKLDRYWLQFIGNYEIVIFHFFGALTRLALYHEVKGLRQMRFQRQVNAYLRALKQKARYCPANYIAKIYLVEAERARIFKQDLKAMEFYQKALTAAKENNNLQEEALANELAGKFYYAKQMAQIGELHLRNAYYGYLRWGAANKVKAMEGKYPALFLTGNEAAIKTTSSAKIFNNNQSLDTDSILKATGAISGEIVLEKLLIKLMEIILENAGAQKIIFMLKKEHELVIEASGTSDDSHINVLQAVPVWKSEDLPIGIVNYASRTGESVVLNDAVTAERFSADPYVLRRQPKSVLCMPVMNKSELKGLLYLENSAITGAFSEERIKILNILTSQVAISIENADLYTRLDDLVQERTRELSLALANLQKTQSQLIESEKMAALGQLVAGIAHEINSPLGAIRASIGNIMDSLQQVMVKLPQLFKMLTYVQQQLFFQMFSEPERSYPSYSSREERQLKKTLLSRLAAYEIENSEPIADILVYLGVIDGIEAYLPLLTHPANLLIMQTAYYLSGIQRNGQNIGMATERAAKMVFALKNYARFDPAEAMALADITVGIETVLTLYQNQIKQATEVIRDYAQVPPIFCYPDELNQVWTNIIQNALQAMEFSGKLEISLRQEGEWVVVKITDSGQGIPNEITGKIFEPFFTTKPQGEGTGMGLDIVKKIITKHHGDIGVESRPGRTTFTVKLPRNLE